MESTSVTKLFPDFPIGPLSVYRENATFDWRKLKLAIDGEEILQYKNNLFLMLEEFDSKKEISETLSLKDQRILSQNRMKLITSKTNISYEEIQKQPQLQNAWYEVIFSYDTVGGMAYSITHKFFTIVVRFLGSARHQKFLDDVYSNKITGCFALTEVAHGSNARGMKTTATIDPKTNEFIMHSENFEAAKCWSGLLGSRATHAVVYAKLISADGKDQGLHAFIVPVRCTKTLKPFPGIIVGDMGEKMALNGIDNGFLMFNSYRIPAENLLDSLGDVDENGNYFSLIENPNLRFAMSLSALSSGRVHIGALSSCNLKKAITIAIRYSAVRKQFGPEGSKEEFPVLEYQQQRLRLIPYLSAAYAMSIFSKWFTEMHSINELTTRDPAIFMEFHGLSSSTKPCITWTSRDGIQICREACGGHGYLKAAGFGELRAENDATCTYEGENSLLLQQTSNWLLSLVKKIEKGENIITPYNTVAFLNDYSKLLGQKVKFVSISEILDMTNILNSYRWLICKTLKLTSEKVDLQLQKGFDSFSARNDSQAFHATTLSIVFAEYSIIRIFLDFAMKINDHACKAIMLKIGSLYGAWSLEKHLGSLYIGGYYSNNEAKLLRDGIIELCEAIAPDAVSLVDAIAVPDFMLLSVLGRSDGMVYKNMQNHIFSMSDTFTKPRWWREVTNQSQSKL